MAAMTIVTADQLCAYCNRPSDELVTYDDGVSICPPCRQREVDRLDASKVHTCGYVYSAHVGGRCPTELGPEGARANWGDH